MYYYYCISVHISSCVFLWLWGENNFGLEPSLALTTLIANWFIWIRLVLFGISEIRLFTNRITTVLYLQTHLADVDLKSKHAFCLLFIIQRLSWNRWMGNNPEHGQSWKKESVILSVFISFAKRKLIVVWTATNSRHAWMLISIPQLMLKILCCSSSFLLCVLLQW